MKIVFQIKNDYISIITQSVSIDNLIFNCLRCYFQRQQKNWFSSIFVDRMSKYRKSFFHFQIQKMQSYFSSRKRHFGNQRAARTRMRSRWVFSLKLFNCLVVYDFGTRWKRIFVWMWIRSGSYNLYPIDVKRIWMYLC